MSEKLKISGIVNALNRLVEKQGSFQPVQLQFTGGINPKGAYNPATAYITGDSVLYTDGCSYIAIQNTIGNAPTNTTYWQKLADKGPAGPAGLTGATGDDGINAINMLNGAGAPASGLGVDNDYYLNNSNGDVYHKQSGSWVLIANFTGPTGIDGVGVPSGGNTGQVLSKKTNTNFDTEWIDPPAGSESGWLPIVATLTRVSATSAYISGDWSAKLQAGDKLKLTQTTAKYFFVTVVSAYDSGNDRTTLTLYGGTDYTLADASITSPNFSRIKAPLGFPLDPTKWTVSLVDANDRRQNSPTSTVWYNVGSLSIVIPSGLWNVKSEVVLDGRRSSSGAIDVSYTLSTSNNSESNGRMTIQNIISSISEYIVLNVKEVPLSLSSPTTYYLLVRMSGSNLSSVALNGVASSSATRVSAICAYL